MDEQTTGKVDLAKLAADIELDAFLENAEVQRAKVKPRPTIVDVAKIIAERHVTHGDFKEAADIAQRLKAIMHVSGGWANLNAMQREALENNATKIARILAGDADFAEHWRDIEGYGKLVADRLG